MRPGTLRTLTAEEKDALADLERRLKLKPEPVTTATQREGRKRRHLRFLRAEKFNVDSAFDRILNHANWWTEYGMDDFSPSDELGQEGPVFVCGYDKWGQPTLVARPCVHQTTSDEHSIQAVRRCVYTMQRCVERMPPGREQIVLIYDVEGISWSNFDTTFSRELVATLGERFPERLKCLIVINNGWLTQCIWAIISQLIDPVTKQKIRFCGSDFRDELLEVLPEDHPYLCYAMAVQSSEHDSAPVPLPKASPYVDRWKECVAADYADPLADGDHQPKTTANDTINHNRSNFAIAPVVKKPPGLWSFCGRLATSLCSANNASRDAVRKPLDVCLSSLVLTSLANNTQHGPTRAERSCDGIEKETPEVQKLDLAHYPSHFSNISSPVEQSTVKVEQQLDSAPIEEEEEEKSESEIVTDSWYDWFDVGWLFEPCDDPARTT